MKMLRCISALSLIVSLSSCGKGLSVDVDEVRKAKVELTIAPITTGKVDSKNHSVLAFGSQGRVVKISVSEGDKVHKGQVLSELENTELSISEVNAVNELARSEKLFAERLISKTQLDESRRVSAMAKASLDRSRITAPFDGTVAEMNLKIGEAYPSTGTGSISQAAKAPIRLVDSKSRIVKANIDELDLAKVKLGTIARIKIPAVRSVIFNATISDISPVVTAEREQDRSISIELNLDTENQSIPVGASADVELVIQEKQDVPSVLTRSLLGMGSRRYVYKYDNGRAKKTDIKLGIGNYDRTEILEGLAIGDKVIIPSEQIELKEDMKVHLSQKK